MSLQFMAQKSYHPNTTANRVKVRQAEIRAAEAKKREDNRQKILKEERERYGGNDPNNPRSAVAFMYELPPGLVVASKEAPKNEGTSDASVENTTKDVSATSTEKEGAPLPAPAPQEKRNLRCYNCGEWGHKESDRVCKREPIKGENLEGASQRMIGDNIMLTTTFRPTYNKDALNETLVNSDDEDSDEDLEAKFLATLTKKQKRKILRYFKKQEKMKMMEESGWVEKGASEKKDKKDKKDKKGKSSHRSKRKHHSSSSSDSESDRERKRRHHK